MSLWRVIAASLLAALSVACTTAPKTIYQWDAYQGNLYEYFKGDGTSPGDQLAALQAQAEKVRAAGAVLPPGFRAHMAMLYIHLGRPEEARQALEAEKAAFPESAQYMDFVLKSMGDRFAASKGA